MADQKLSELSALTSASSSDLVYVVTNGLSKKMTVGNLASSVQVISNISAGIFRTAGSSTVTSAGTSNTTAWFSFDKTKYWALKVGLAARDLSDIQNHYFGYAYITSTADPNTFDIFETSHTGGVNQIYVQDPQVSGNNVSLVFYRDSSSTTQIKAVFEAELYLI